MITSIVLAFLSVLVPPLQTWSTTDHADVGAYLTPHCGIEFNSTPTHLAVRLYCDDKSDWTEWNTL